MRHHMLVGTILAVLLGTAQLANAAGGGHGGMHGGGMNAGIGALGGHDMSGGSPGDRMSMNGQTNSDRQSSPDATRGLDRAQQRMSEEGIEHQKATAHQKQGKTKSKTKTAKKPKQTPKTKADDTL